MQDLTAVIYNINDQHKEWTINQDVNATPKMEAMVEFPTPLESIHWRSVSL